MKYLALGLIKVYQLCIAPFLGSNCRFAPSCSEYASEAFRKHGFFRGTCLTIKRLAKCGPWHSGGVDEVP